MSPRAAWRLETLGFDAYDYADGKADWIAHGLPREGQNVGGLYAGEMIDRDPPTCPLSADLGAVRAALEGSQYGFCLVTGDERILLGRVRKSELRDADSGVRAEDVMEPGPSTVRPNTPAKQLAERLAKRELRTAIVTTPEGRLLGVFHRADAEQRLA
jgi:CBS domain-containing protein